MLFRILSSFIVLVWICAAALAQPMRHPDASPETKALVKRAIAAVNELTASDSIRLSLKEDDDGAIPVHLLRSTTIAEVPANCACIHLGGIGIRRMFKEVSSEPLLEDNMVHYLSFILLHEIGHIHNGDHGAFITKKRAPLNNDDNADKDREIAADDYVIDKLKFDPDVADDQTMQKMLVGLALTSYNFIHSTKKSLDECFGGRVLGSPCIFWDHGQSHPNFEYRLLRINHAIHPSETSKRLLEDFENARKKAGSIVIVGPNGERRTIDEDDPDFEAFKSIIRSLPGVPTGDSQLK